MSVNIEGLLRNCKRRKITFMMHDDGSKMTDTEARLYLAEAQAMGWRLLPMQDCDGFDYQNGCPGHPIPETEVLKPLNA
jgi:hypothetical protein